MGTYYSAVGLCLSKRYTTDKLPKVQIIRIHYCAIMTCSSRKVTILLILCKDACHVVQHKSEAYICELIPLGWQGACKAVILQIQHL